MPFSFILGLHMLLANPQTKHYFIYNKFNYILWDFWYNPENKQPSASTMWGRGRQTLDFFLELRC